MAVLFLCSKTKVFSPIKLFYFHSVPRVKGKRKTCNNLLFSFELLYFESILETK